MHSSHHRTRGSTQDVAVRKLVAERAGREWCLFLDRDGVLNRQVVGDYVRSWAEFEWLPSAKRAVKVLGEWAPRIVVVTNQQGIGKGLMRTDDVEAIHRKLQSEIAAGGVLIDAFQVCPHLESVGCGCRKPRPDLILGWLQEHPEIDDSLSIMVGDSQSDIELAQQVSTRTGGCASIRIGRHDSQSNPVDAAFDSLWDFASTVARIRVEDGV